MLYEVQVHFANKGYVAFVKEIANPHIWLAYQVKQQDCIDTCEHTKKIFYYPTKDITGITLFPIAEKENAIDQKQI